MEPPKIGELFAGLDSFLEMLLPFGVLVAVVFIVIGGYMWMTSAGNPDKVKQAQGTLTWAIIGLIFILVASLLITTIIDYFL